MCNDAVTPILFLLGTCSILDDKIFGNRSMLIENTTEILNSLLNGYSKCFRPSFGGPKIVISIDMLIRSMGPVSERDMSYSVDCYFRQSWRDSRLSYIAPSPLLRTLSLNIKMLSAIWRPDTYFYNGQHSYLHTITYPNQLLRISEDGTVYYSQRLTIRARCLMKLHTYPMDTQHCPLILGSYGYSRFELDYVWKKPPALVSGLTLSQFDLVDTPHGNITEEIREDCDGKDDPFFLTSLFLEYLSPFIANMLGMPMPGEIITFSSMEITNSCIGLPIFGGLVMGRHMGLWRHMGYFLIQVYVPCALLVVLSWVGFWINREATSDRVALGVTTVLTMAFIALDTRQDLPKVSYSTALDQYVFLCYAFILASIIEFATVHYFTKFGSGENPDDESDAENDNNLELEINKRRDTRSLLAGTAKLMAAGTMAGASGNSASSGRNGQVLFADLLYKPLLPHENCCERFLSCLKGSYTYRYLKKKSGDGVNSVSRIDRISRIAFPLSFTVINVIYWVVYMKDDHYELVVPKN